MRLITEYLSANVKPNIIHATNATIHKIVKNELDRLGHDADLNHIDVSKVTNMNSLFSCAYSDLGSKYEDLNPDISKWDVSNVINMGYMFYECKNFNCDISQWDVSKVVDMQYMFYNCKNFNQDISNWKPKITRIQGVFCDCPLKTEFRPKYFGSEERIDEYLSTSNINKDAINPFADDYCIADPINEFFKKFLKEYKDNVVQLTSGIKIFILTKQEIAEHGYGYEDDIAIYKIPKKYKNFKSLKEYLENERYLNNLEEYEQNEILTW